MNSQQLCPSASLYDLVTRHWPLAVAASPVVSSSASGTQDTLLAQLADLRASVVEPNAAWFKAHSFTGAIVFPLATDMVTPMVTVSPGSGAAQSGIAEPAAATNASSSTASTTNNNNGGNGGRLRLRRRFPQGQGQGQVPGGGAPTTTVQARVPRQFVYIYHSEVIGVQYVQPNASSPPNVLIPKVSNPAFLESSHPCNSVKSPWQPYRQSLPADLAGSLVGCTSSTGKPAVSCFVLNVKPAPDCSIPSNCYGEPASIKSIMQVMARASAGMPTVGSAAPSDDPAASPKGLPVYAWIAIAAGTLALAAGAAFFLIRRKRASGVRRASANSAYAKLTAAATATRRPSSSSSPPGSSSALHMLSPPPATAQPPSTSPLINKRQASLDRTHHLGGAPPPLVVPAARRPASHLLTPPAPNSNLVLTTQTLDTSASTSPPPLHVPVPVPADTLAHMDSAPVPLPSHLATPAVRLLCAASLAHVPSRAFVGLSGDLAADLSLQDLVDGWVSVLDLARAVARARGVPLGLVGAWVVGAIDGLAKNAPADARASARGMVDWYRRLARDTKGVGLAAGGKPASGVFVRDVVVPALAHDGASDADRVKVATAAVVAFVRVKSMRPYAVLSEAVVGERVDARVVKVAEEFGRASLARRGGEGERVRESVFPGLVDVVDGVVLAHARVGL